MRARGRSISFPDDALSSSPYDVILREILTSMCSLSLTPFHTHTHTHTHTYIPHIRIRTNTKWIRTGLSTLLLSLHKNNKSRLFIMLSGYFYSQTLIVVVFMIIRSFLFIVSTFFDISFFV